MARPRHLNHAPITEALIDIRVEPRAGLGFAELQSAFGIMDFGYYLKSPISQGMFGCRLTSDGQQPQTTAAAEQIGLRLHSADEKYVAQCRVNGFTLSRLPPYEAPQSMTSFFQSFHLAEVSDDAYVNLTVALESTPPEGPVPVVLDVDAFANKNLSTKDDELWEVLDRLRDLKNRCFFGSLTEHAVELSDCTNLREIVCNAAEGHANPGYCP